MCGILTRLSNCLVRQGGTRTLLNLDKVLCHRMDCREPSTMPTVQIVRIDANLPLQCHQSHSGNWIGVCEPLKMTVQSSTWGELMEDFSLALNGILIDLMQTNEFDRFLRDKGWKLLGQLPARPKNIRFDVPFLPALMANHGPQNNLHQ
jgi:hypothetical protein